MKRMSFRRTLWFFTVVFLASCSSGIFPEPSAPDDDLSSLATTTASATVLVAAGNDDAEQNTSSGAVVLTNTGLTLGNAGTAAQTVGLRFQNVGIPKGATITGAYLELKASANQTGTAALTIKGELADSPGVYTTTSKNLTLRTKTAASSSWSATSWTSGTLYRSGSLVTVVQEITSRPGWFQSNALALQITGTGSRKAYAFEGGAANAPKLVVTYTYDPAVSPTYLKRSVSLSSDDAKQPGTGAVVTNSTVLELGKNGTTAQTIGLRFSNLTIPTGARIDSAVIEVTSSAADSSTASLTVAGEAADNAATYTTATGSISKRLQTTAKVTWSPEAFATATDYRSPPLQSVLQQIVNRPGWKSGNAAAFVISGTGTRRVSAFEGGSAKAARLIISYTPMAAPPPPSNPCNSLSGSLPNPWQSADLGTVSAAGKAGSASSVFDLCGYGNGLDTTTDSFHFVRQTLTDDGTLTARVTSLDAAAATARAGVIVRESLDTGAKYAAVTLAGGNQTAFSSRGGTTATSVTASSSVTATLKDVANGITPAATDTSTSGMVSTIQGVDGELSPQAAQLTAPYWLRLTRKGSTLTGYTSADGQTWTSAGSTTITMAQGVQVGLFVTGQGSTTPATARFDNVMLGPIIDSGDPFSITAVNPTQVSNTAPATLTVTGTGFGSETSFFVQSTQLEVQSVNATSASLTMPAGFLPNTYGLMAANSAEQRDALYPAFEVTAGPPPAAIDPKLFSRSFVDGFVTDAETGSGLEGVRVSFPGLETLTSAEGYFILRGVPTGRHTVKLEAPGRETIYRIAEVNETVGTVTLNHAALEAVEGQATTIGSAGGVHQTGTGAVVRIPEGALAQPVEIRATFARSAAAIPELPEAGYYLGAVHLTPGGVTLKKPATVMLPLPDGVSLAAGMKILVSHFDERQARWIPEITSGIITQVNGQAYVEYEVNHFGWLLAQGQSSSVQGRVQYSDGSPAVGVTTNFGVTDANGVFRGTLPSSTSGRTVQAYAVNPVQRAASTVEQTYSGSGTLNFADPVVLPGRSTPQAYEPFFVSYDPLEAAFSQLKLEEQAQRREVYGDVQRRIEAADNSYHQLVFRERMGRMVTYIPDVSKAYLQLDEINLTFAGQDVTGTANFEYIRGDQIEISLTNNVYPFPSGLSVEVALAVSQRNSVRAVATATPNVVADVQLPDMEVVAFPDDAVPAETSTPYMEDDGETLTYYVRQGDLSLGEGLGEVTVDAPVSTVDDNGQTLAINALDTLSLADVRSSYASIEDGVAHIPITVSIPAGGVAGQRVQAQIAAICTRRIVVDGEVYATGYGQDSREGASGVAIPDPVQLTPINRVGGCPTLEQTSFTADNSFITLNVSSSGCTIPIDSNGVASQGFSSQNVASENAIIPARQATSLGVKIDGSSSFYRRGLHLYINDEEVTNSSEVGYENGITSVTYYTGSSWPIGPDILVELRLQTPFGTVTLERTRVDVIHMLQVLPVSFLELTEDEELNAFGGILEGPIETPFPVFSPEKGAVVVLYRPGDSFVDTVIPIPVIATDEAGLPLPLNYSSVTLDTSAWYSYRQAEIGTAPMVDGVAYVPWTISDYNFTSTLSHDLMPIKQALITTEALQGEELSAQQVIIPRQVPLLPAPFGANPYAPTPVDPARLGQELANLTDGFLNTLTEALDAELKQAKLLAALAVTVFADQTNYEIEYDADGNAAFCQLRKFAAKSSKAQSGLEPKVIDYANPNDPDCGSGPGGPEAYNGPEIPKAEVATARANGVFRAWYREIKYLAKHPTSTGFARIRWSDTELTILRRASSGIDNVAAETDIITRAKKLRTLLSTQNPNNFLESLTNIYNGHHINAVSRNPNLAGEARNITFVTKESHYKNCHEGDTNSQTTGELLPETPEIPLP